MKIGIIVRKFNRPKYNRGVRSIVKDGFKLCPACSTVNRIHRSKFIALIRLKIIGAPSITNLNIFVSGSIKRFHYCVIGIRTARAIYFTSMAVRRCIIICPNLIACGSNIRTFFCYPSTYRKIITFKTIIKKRGILAGYLDVIHGCSIITIITVHVEPQDKLGVVICVVNRNRIHTMHLVSRECFNCSERTTVERILGYKLISRFKTINRA